MRNTFGPCSCKRRGKSLDCAEMYCIQAAKSKTTELDALRLTKQCLTMSRFHVSPIITGFPPAVYITEALWREKQRFHRQGVKSSSIDLGLIRFLGINSRENGSYNIGAAIGIAVAERGQHRHFGIYDTRRASLASRREPIPVLFSFLFFHAEFTSRSGYNLPSLFSLFRPVFHSQTQLYAVIFIYCAKIATSRHIYRLLFSNILSR